MGLDMYAHSVPASVVGDEQIDIPLDKATISSEMAYWRKFNQLHGWMEDLYRSKGGKEEFNCETVRLTREDLEELSEWLATADKPSRPGFFFGNGEIHPGHITNTEEFIKKALNEIATGNAVIYHSWW